jgi:large subunit ribosomal protein L19
MLVTEVKGIKVQIGDTLRVKTTVIEGGKSRIQTFEGILIALKGRGEDKMMTVRRIGVKGVGVERMWPVNARSLVGVEVVKSAKKVRRSKLYFMRELVGKSASRI